MDMQELQQSLENISIHLYSCSHVGRQKNVHQPVFPYNVIENPPTFLAHNSAIDGPNDFKFGTETCYMVFQGILKFGRN